MPSSLAGGERETSDILPSELWTEILVRLPVRSLLSLKSVSKTFLSLIQNPNFPSLHFSRFRNHNNNLLLLERPTVGTFSGACDYFLLHRSFTPESTTEFKFRIHFGAHCGVIGYVHGLLWFFRSKAYSTDMILCNPSIRKSLIVPQSPSSPPFIPTSLGFGYDPVTNDYKAVLILHVGKDDPLTFVEIYSFRSNSWRSIGYDALNRGWFLDSNVYVNGVLHWIAGLDENCFGPDEYELSHVISFDLGTELFSYTKLPDFVIGDDGPIKLLLLFNGSLAVFYITARHICVWVMREGSEWTKEWMMESVPVLYNYLVDESSRISSVIFCEGSNELLVAGYYGMVSYEIETQQFKFRDPSVVYVDKYVDSLLWRDCLPHWTPLSGTKYV